jgi:uncharacterized protein (TIGR02996 family)
VSEREALLAAIRQFPEEDTPRLVFADWLDEHGEGERAAMIRYSCSPKFSNRRTAEFRRVKRIAERWFPIDKFFTYFAPRDCADFAHNGASSVMESLFRLPPNARKRRVLFDRGLVIAVRCSAEQWIEHADAILAEHPVRWVRLTTRPDGLHWCYDRITPDMYPHPVTDEMPYTNDESLLIMLRREWPGITFQVPHEPDDLDPETLFNAAMDSPSYD